MNIEAKNFEFTPKMTKTVIVGILIGLISLALTFKDHKTQAWINVLVNSYYFVTVGAVALFFLCIQSVTNASWMAPYKRLTESFTKFLPVGLILMLTTYFGLHDIYEWTHTELVNNDPILIQKTPWLNIPFYMIRMVIYVGAWIACATKLRSLHKKQDTEHSEAINHKLLAYGALGTLVFAIGISFSAFDWLMSIEPHWFSTIYGVYCFSGAFVATVCLLVLALLKLKELGYYKGLVTDDHMHDLGKLMFGFSVFWAYIWVSQYILIWYSNIPEETEYYILRSHNGFSAYFWAVVGINFIFPFFALMTRAAKRDPKRLKLVACVLLLGHWLDIYVMVAPKIVAHHHGEASIGLSEVGIFIGYLSLFIFVVGKAFSKVEIVAKNDPYLEEGVNLHQ